MDYAFDCEDNNNKRGNGLSGNNLFFLFKDILVTFPSTIKNYKILQIILLLRLNISVKFKHNTLINNTLI